MRAFAGSFFTLILLSCALQSARTQQAISFFDYIGRTELLEIDLTTDLQLLRNQRNTNEYQQATLTFSQGKKQRESWEIKIRSRGKYRRKICQFPPLKLNFPKDTLKARGLSSDDEYKLVTHCLSGAAGKEYLLREYLVYKLYAQLSPFHFRVQLCKIRYLDPNSGEKILAWAIFMEDENTLAKRFDAKICEDCYALEPDQFRVGNPEQVFLFEYLIGNTDLSLALLRNLVMLKPKSGSPPVIVPFDFDFSGMVNASYARPNADYRQANIRERMFIQPDIPDTSLASAIELFKSKRKALETVILSFKYLGAGSKNDMLAYLAAFYDSLDSGIQRPNPQNP
jgi:hypothetical protein